MSGRSIQWERAAALAFSLSNMAQDRRNNGKMGPAKDEPDKQLSGHSRPAREAPSQLSGFLSVLANMLLVCAIDALYLTLRERIGYT